MSDHDFEKRVKQRMDELRFKPSEAVWQNLERELRKDKPSRRGWLWIPAALLLLGTGGYFAVQQFGGGSKDAVQTVSSNEPQTNSSNELSSANEKNSTLDQGNAGNKAGATNSDEQTKTGLSENNRSATDVAVKAGVENKSNIKKSLTPDYNEALVVKGKRSGKASGLKPVSKSVLVSAGKSKTKKAENANEEQSSMDESAEVPVQKSSLNKGQTAQSDVAQDKNEILASTQPLQEKTDSTTICIK
ncbi:MAG: hypothetical protein ABW036_09905 [Flavitalea sp.]